MNHREPVRAIALDLNKVVERYSRYSETNQDVIEACLREHRWVVKGQTNLRPLIKSVLHGFNAEFGSQAWEHHYVFWRDLLGHLLKRPPKYEEILAIYSSYLAKYVSIMTLYEDVIPFLEECRGRWPVCVVANGGVARINKFLEENGLDEYLDAIVISGESPFRKPDTFMLRYASAKLGISVENIALVGDRYDNDMLCAAKVGAWGVHLLRHDVGIAKSPGPYCVADWEVDNLQQALEALSSPHPDVPILLPVESQCGRTPDTTTYRPVREALVLCGGSGSRLGELGRRRQKCLFEVQGRSILEYVLRGLTGAGITKVVCILGHLGGQVRDHVNGLDLPLEFEFLEGRFKGTAHALTTALQAMKGAFFYCHGNIIVPPRLFGNLAIRFSTSTAAGTVGVSNYRDDLTHPRCTTTGDLVNEIADPADAPKQGALLSVGLAIFDPEIVRRVVGIHDREGMAEVVTYKALSTDTILEAVQYQGPWFHFETQEDIERSPNWNLHTAGW